MVKSIGFDRFMASEGTETLILALTSKTGQSVVHTSHRIKHGNTDLRYHISRLNPNPQHISCRVDTTYYQSKALGMVNSNHGFSSLFGGDPP